MPYVITLLIDNDIPETLAATATVIVGTVIDCGDETGLGVVGRILRVTIRAEASRAGLTGEAEDEEPPHA